MQYIKTTLAALAALTLAACANRIDFVSQRAPFDLNCPREKVNVQLIGDTDTFEKVYGATGCGKRITYKAVGYCDGIGWCRVDKETRDVIIQGN